MHRSVKHVVRLGLYSAIALILFLLEAQFPSPVLYVPGIKLGLSNIVTLFMLSCETRQDALAVLLVRVLLGSFFAGQMMMLLYSLAGGLLSLGAMILCSILLKREGLWFTGIVGGAMHNLGQLMMAAMLMQTTSVFAYLPVLILCGMAAGFFSGMTAGFFVRRWKRMKLTSCTEKSKNA